MTDSSNSPEQYAAAKTFQGMLDQCQWLEPAELKRLQNEALSNIILHAWNTVPFYRDRIASLIDWDGSIRLANWSKVPFLTRRDIQDNFDTLKSNACPEAHGQIIEAKSSGSTAEPVKVLTTQFASVASAVASKRGMAWAHIDYSLNQAQIIPMSDGVAPYPGVKIDASWAPFWIEDTASGDWHQLDHTTSHKQQLDWLSHRGRCYLNTMPSNVRELAGLASENPDMKPEVAGMLTLGEIVSNELRDLVRETLDCEIHDSYSTEEFGSIGWQCPDGTNLHVADELFLLEVIDEESGEPCEPGETGSVVITSFYNYAMPLIRYKLGDLATSGPPCPCGRGLTSLTNIAGRRRQLFRFPGGETIMPGLATRIFVEYLHARKWQAAQIGDEVIEIRFVSDAPEDQQDREAFATAANKRFQRELKYVFKQMGVIPPQPSGKFFEYVCELPEAEN